VLDVAIAAAVVAVGAAEVLVPLPSRSGDGSAAWSTGVAVVAGSALLLRRTRPLVAAAVVFAAWPAAELVADIHVLFWGGLVPIVAATYAVARHGSRRHGVAGGLLAAALLLVLDLTVEELQQPSEVVFHWMVVGGAWGLGRYVHERDARATAAEREAAVARAAEVEAARRAASAVAEERARIARELHDVVAHAVTAMVVQAGAAEQVVDDDPVLTRRALESIRSTGGEALAEMRRLLGLLRTGEEADLAPQPGLGSLQRLLDDARAGGLDVVLHQEGPAVPLSPGVDLAAYRVVQEALTNVRRHAGARRAQVVLRWTRSGLDLEVVDDGRGGPVVEGNGVIGMRERVSLYGGSLEALPRQGGGVAVRAHLPLPSPAGGR